jgi:very-short-patch-repair endonuclease
VAIMTTETRWWAEPPPGQASYLADVDPALLGVGLDPLPPGAPATVRFRPTSAVRVGQHVTAFLDALDRAAVALFPRWLPGAEHFDGASGLTIAATRALATRIAARSDHFGPFLADTAERALRGSTARHRFPDEVRARGLGGILASAYGRTSAAVLVDVPEHLTPAAERALAAAAVWLAEQGRFTVWLAGPPLRSVDHIQTIKITLPSYLTRLVAEVGPVREPIAGPLLTYPPLSGVPRADSPAERALERALASHEWARGRRWNWVLDWHPLGKAYRLDLYWPDDGLVVEVDGDDHRERWKFADDRHRDVQLQLGGHNVLRFTNDQVLTDPSAAAQTIRDLLRRRRNKPPEMRQHANG